MKKKIAISIILLFVIVLLSVSLTGCGEVDATTTPQVTVYVIGAHANSKPMDFFSETTVQSVYSDAQSSGKAYVVIAEGEPRKVDEQDFFVGEQYKNASRAALKNYANRMAQDFLERVSDVHALTPEVDYLEAINISARAMSTSLDGSIKRIVISPV